ncbi:MAG: hypothetical protein AAF202_10965, partial [Pseudomonadota bacterium]
MKLAYSEYEIPALAALNAKAGKAPLRGCLLRLETHDGKVGYSDLRPHEALGDQPMMAQLLSLRGGMPHDLAARSLISASLDAQARSEGRSLLSDLALPETHALGGPLRDASEEWLADTLH